MRARFPATRVRYDKSDLREPLSLGPIDGVVMANSLHFIKDRQQMLARIQSMLVPGGHLILVEYDSDSANPWVPHPLSFGMWERVAAKAGFRETTLLQRIPSRFLGAIYSALSVR